MADNQDRVSALLQRTQEMRARAAIVLNFVPTSDDSSDDRWGDALVTSLARDVVALTEELERLAGVSGSPDETRVARAKISDALGALHVLQSRADRILNGHDDANEMARDIRTLRLEAHEHLVAASRALAGVGEHRPTMCPCTDVAGSEGRGAPDPDCDRCEGSGEHRPEQKVYAANDLPAFGTQVCFALDVIRDWWGEHRPDQPQEKTLDSAPTESVGRAGGDA